MNSAFESLVALFPAAAEARAASRSLINQGMPRFNVSALDVNECRAPQRPRRAAACLTGALFGALETAGLVLAARLYPALEAYFAGDWRMAAAAGAALGGLGGGFIGLVLSSVLADTGPRPGTVMGAEGDWPEGGLLSLRCDRAERAKWEAAL